MLISMYFWRSAPLAPSNANVWSRLWYWDTFAIEKEVDFIAILRGWANQYSCYIDEKNSESTLKDHFKISKHPTSLQSAVIFYS